VTEAQLAPKSELAERIRARALEEFAALGYSVSLQQIADRAGCTKANVLYHFGSKEQLAHEVLEPTVEASAALEAQLAADPDFDVAYAAAELMLRNRLAVQLLMFHHRSLPDKGESLQLLRIIERVAARLDPSDPTAPTRCVIGLIGIAYLLSIGPDDLEGNHGMQQLDLTDPQTLAALIRQLTLAPAADAACGVATPTVPATQTPTTKN
jgi:AcrR family transcriptional regulator